MRNPMNGVATLVIAGFALVALTGCGPTVTAPDVVGMRLDEAHRTFEKLDVTNFDDVDGVGEDRSILWDSNWVVVSQDPAAGTEEVDTGATIRLKVAKQDDKQLLTLIPTDSPVAKEHAKRAEDDAAEKKERAEREEERAEQKKLDDAKKAREAKKAAKTAAAKYSTDLDESFEGFAGVTRIFNEHLTKVRAQGGGPEVAATNIIAARDFYDTGSGFLPLKTPPGAAKLGNVHMDMAESMAQMSLACDALLLAIDTGAPSALASATRDRDEATARWEKAVRKISKTAGKKPIVP